MTANILFGWQFWYYCILVEMYMCQALSYSLYIAKRTAEEPLINNDADREAHVILQGI